MSQGLLFGHAGLWAQTLSHQVNNNLSGALLVSL